MTLEDPDPERGGTVDQRERPQRFEARMSEHEAVMWNVEKDPWLNPSGAAVVLLDRPVDMARLRRKLRRACTRIPRLVERVVPGLGRLSAPGWVTDPEFDFDHHLRHLRLPEPGTERQLLDLVTRLYEDPFDRTRPLWLFVAIDGLEGGRAAVFSKIHHAVADGIGALRIAEAFQELERRDKPVPEVDLEGFVAQRFAEQSHRARQGGADLGDNLVGTAFHSVAQLLGRQGELLRRAAGEVALWPADPVRVGSLVGSTTRLVRTAGEALTGGDRSLGRGSPLWAGRSRHRHLEHVRVPLGRLKEAGRALGGSVNDAFMTGAVEAAVRYHADRDVTLDSLNVSFVVSTRTDVAVGGNAFTPVILRVPAGPMPIGERFGVIRDLVAAKRAEATATGGLGPLMALANLLPTSVVTRTARAQAARLDFATSNLRGARFPVYVSGAKVLATIPMGPVAGTACNITAMSYQDNLDIGVLSDPKAIGDAEALRRHLAGAYDDLIAAGAAVAS
jgi:WS/DGAT/MGAT family acyltransferase